MNNLYVQYGCGLSAPDEWLNFDVSPTLRMQKIPLAGNLLKKNMRVVFPANARYGDIIKGLPVPENSCKGVYCSHTLEHLSLDDLRTALRNTYALLQPGGLFRCVVPDLEYSARQYLAALGSGDSGAGMRFMGPDTLLGIEARPRGFNGFMRSFFGNSHHLWMWDYPALSAELQKAGFKEIRRCNYNDSKDEMFRHVEDIGRFVNALAIESVR